MFHQKSSFTISTHIRTSEEMRMNVLYTRRAYVVCPLFQRTAPWLAIQIFGVPLWRSNTILVRVNQQENTGKLCTPY